MGQPKHPLYWIYSGLILLLIPVIFMITGLYKKSHSAQWTLPPLPSKEVLLRRLAVFDSSASDFQLDEVYQATPTPHSGVLAVYGVLTDDEVLAYRLVVVRHDIACATCRDLLAGILLEPSEDRVVAVWPLTSWELADGPFAPTAFFTQLSGRLLSEPLAIGRDLDGVTGATLSVQALVNQWKQAGHWLAESK